MADEKRKQCYNSNWSKVPVLIEEALDDVIVVCLKLGTKEFRGILLDTAKRNVPHGVCFAPKPAKSDKCGENDVNSTSIPGNGIGHQQVSVSTTSQRFTYNHDPSVYSEKPILLGHKSNIRPVVKKSVRDIRLRPRQTLCWNCKNVIHDHNKHEKGKSSASNTLSSSKAGKSSSVSSTRSPSRYLAPPKNSKPSSSRSPSHYVSNRTVTTCKWSLRNRSNSKEVLLRLPEPIRKRSCSNTSSSSHNRTIEQEVKPKITKVEKPSSPKATPFIKISYGDGAVLNIPPRLPGMDNNGVLESSSEDPSASPQKEVQNYLSHKKLKKALKKAKERERHRSGDQIAKSVSDETEEKLPKISSHHKKHKRKHKHRHSTQYSTTEIPDGEHHVIGVSELVSNDWNGNEESNHMETSNETNYEDKTQIVNGDNDSCSKVEDNGNDSEYVEYEEHPLVIDESPDVTNEGKDDTTDKISTMNNYPDWIDHIDTENNEDHENARPLDKDSSGQRPRLVYMWKQNQGLARVEPRTGDSQSVEKRGSMSSDDLDEDTESRYSASDISDSYDGSDSETCNNYPGSPQSEVTDPPVDTLRPLMMKIQSQNVSKCVVADDRTIHVDDIVWGKIKGFPWWPGRVISIMVTQKDNGIIIAQTAHVSWFGSSTMSHMQCSELYPFLEDFKLRYNKKKRGPYRSAIKQATVAAQATFSNDDANIDIDMDQFEL